MTPLNQKFNNHFHFNFINLKNETYWDEQSFAETNGLFTSSVWNGRQIIFGLWFGHVDLRIRYNSHFWWVLATFVILKTKSQYLNLNDRLLKLCHPLDVSTLCLLSPRPSARPQIHENWELLWPLSWQFAVEFLARIRLKRLWIHLKSQQVHSNDSVRSTNEESYRFAWVVRDLTADSPRIRNHEQEEQNAKTDDDCSRNGER